MSMNQRVKELFPQCRFTEHEVNWIGGAYRPGSDAPYVSGYRDHLMLDGLFNTDELLALADWVRNEEGK